MGLFNFSFLKSSRLKELEKKEMLYDQLIEDKKNDDIEVGEVINMLPEPLEEKVNEGKTPYKSLYFVNKHLTVVMHDGSVLGKGDCDKKFLAWVKAAKTEDELYDLFIEQQIIDVKPDPEAIPPIEQKAKEKIATLEQLPPDLERRKDGEVYFKGINLPLPTIMSAAFIGAYLDGREEDYKTLKFFWMWTATNPIESSRKDLYKFIRDHDIKLTANGLMILYRRIVAKNKTKDQALVDAISTGYVKVKGQKKAPKNFYLVYTNEDEDEQVSGERVYKVVKAEKKVDYDPTEVVGNLGELYADLPNMSENIYTDAHSHKMTIKVGSVYSITEKEIDIDSRNDCSRGLKCVVSL